MDMDTDEIIAAYGHLLTNTGGNDPAELLDDLAKDRRMASTNVVRFTLAVAVQSQVDLLKRLHREGLLAGDRH